MKVYCQQQRIVFSSLILWLGLWLLGCSYLSATAQLAYPIVGAERTAFYLPLLQGKKVGLVANQASLLYHENNDSIAPTHLLDMLLRHDVQVQRLFCPEHGFRGDAEAGGKVDNSHDVATGLPIFSLYGSNKKPTVEQLKGLDMMLFDLQDMGVRFYTYISTLHYVMEACAEQGIPLLVMDRYNPHTGYVDGPVLEPAYRSFVGMHPVPVCYGMTIGEYALMINGEHWLHDSLCCALTVIPMTSFERANRYIPRMAPSPNLTTRQAMLLYPSLCLFEGTQVSVGRGTATPFEIIGAPNYHQKTFSFTPHPIPGVSDNPPFNGKRCYGVDLRHEALQDAFSLRYLMQMYHGMPQGSFFLKNGFFDRLAGTGSLRRMMEQGATEEEIRAGWQPALTAFKQIRKRYLLYPDVDTQQ